MMPLPARRFALALMGCALVASGEKRLELGAAGVGGALQGRGGAANHPYLLRVLPPSPHWWGHARP